MGRRRSSSFFLWALTVVAVGVTACGADERDEAVDSPTVAAGREATISSDHVVGCDRTTIGEESGPLVSAYGVDNGELGEPCFGDRQSTVEQAWSDLASISPTELIEGVTVVAGFEPNGSETIAYASPVNDDTEAFLIAVDIETGQGDPGELRLTMAHELAHVFTQTTEQLDVAVYADECDTFFNGFGCFQLDAYMTDWVDSFWDQRDLATLPADGDIDELGGQDRCSIDPAFLGSYAASHPEEDFAESFAAYVFDVDVALEVQPRLAFFDAYPLFVEMRDNVRRAELPELDNNFETCG